MLEMLNFDDGNEFQCYNVPFQVQKLQFLKIQIEGGIIFETFLNCRRAIWRRFETFKILRTYLKNLKKKYGVAEARTHGQNGPVPLHPTALPLSYESRWELQPKIQNMNLMYELLVVRQELKIRFWAEQSLQNNTKLYV